MDYTLPHSWYQYTKNREDDPLEEFFGFFEFLEEDEIEEEFLYVYASQLEDAIRCDDAVTLKNLLDTYGGIGLIDCCGNSLLHYAIFRGSHKAFDVLLQTPGLSIDVRGCDDLTPLQYSLQEAKADMAVKLIQKGADRQSTLHLAVPEELLEISVLLIERGIDIEEVDGSGRTPLAVACDHNSVESVCMLLYFGAHADVTIVPYCLTSSLIREIISDFIFDEHKTPIPLDTLTEACENYRRGEQSQEKSFFFSRFLDSISEITNVIFEGYKLRYAFHGILQLDLKHFETILTHFNSVLKYLMSELIDSQDYIRDITNVTVENWTAIMKSELSLLDLLLKGFQFQFEFHETDTDDVRIKVADLISLFISKGVRICKRDVCRVYSYLGYSSVFKKMLTTDILELDHSNKRKHLMPVLIYDMRMSLETFLDHPRCDEEYDFSTFDQVLEYFCHPRFNEFCSTLSYDSVQRKVKAMPDVPLLAELARNKARKHIIDFYKVENFRSFSDVLDKLDYAPRFKKILTYEQTLYG